MFAGHGEIDGRLVDRRALVVERARQDARRGGLADAAHARQHPRLRDAPGGERVGQRAHHRLLADQFGEIGRPVLAGQDPIGGCPRIVPAFVVLSGFAHPSVPLPVLLAQPTVTTQFHPRAGTPSMSRVRRKREAGTMTRSWLVRAASFGPDPVGEWIVHHQPPILHIGNSGKECKSEAKSSVAGARRPMNRLPCRQRRNSFVEFGASTGLHEA